MAEKTKSNSNGRERERTALLGVVQAVRLTTAALRSIHPGSLIDELETHVERHLRAAEQALAFGE